ncbi:hypothetical protein Tco_1468250 [Tanacetum coccineum]
MVQNHMSCDSRSRSGNDADIDHSNEESQWTDGTNDVMLMYLLQDNSILRNLNSIIKDSLNDPEFQKPRLASQTVDVNRRTCLKPVTTTSFALTGKNSAPVKTLHKGLTKSLLGENSQGTVVSLDGFHTGIHSLLAQQRLKVSLKYRLHRVFLQRKGLRVWHVQAIGSSMSDGVAENNTSGPVPQLFKRRLIAADLALGLHLANDAPVHLQFSLVLLLN